MIPSPDAVPELGLAPSEDRAASDAEEEDEDVRLRKTKALLLVTGALTRRPCVVRIARVEGGRAGMWGGTERVSVKADIRVGRRGRRRKKVEGCMLERARGYVEREGRVWELPESWRVGRR